MAASLTRIVRFHASHRFYRPDWSEARNREAFGALADPPGHGHEYECAVTVRGPVDENGMIANLTLLDRILKEEVVDQFAGKRINDLPAFTSGRPLPTCEAMAAYAFRRITGRLPAGLALERVRVMEDPTLYADCTGLT
ncbi:MAG TPA: 6-carboxytetrahydropterin synthase [Gemmatimonadales bacterium]|nr:6-carboxytetrahydropterin synthase [Gemmatimonadales bacterium]